MPEVLLGTATSVFDIDLEDDGTFADNLAVVESYSYEVRNSTTRADPINRAYHQNQITKKGVRVSATLRSTKSGSIKVCNLDVSAISILGQAYDSYLESGSLTVNQETAEVSALADLFEYNQATGKKSIEFDGVIRIPATAGAGSQALQTALASATVTDSQGTITFTINGVTVTCAMTVESITQEESGGATQSIRLRAVCNAPDSGTFPAAPTGTTTLLERMLNTTTRHRLRFTTHASEGGQWAGNAILTRYTLTIPNQGLVVAECEWLNQGTWTFTAN